MASSNRATQIGKLHRALKKHYKFQAPSKNLSVLDALMLGCCLENAPHEQAAQSLQQTRDSFFDLNEMRVSSIRELAELLEPLPQPMEKATRLRKLLHGVFETMYAFDLDHLRKQNIGQAEKSLLQLEGMNSFVLAYVTQVGLAGHAIPLDEGTCRALYIAGIATPEEVTAQSVTGLTRAIPKTKGIEFAYLLHELGADVLASPLPARAKQVLETVAPDAKERMPQKTSARKGRGEDGAAKKKAEAKPKAKSKTPAKKKVAQSASRTSKPNSAASEKSKSSRTKSAKKTTTKRKPK